MSRTIIHINVADFPVAVEQALEPRLCGRPTAVAVEAAARSLIVAASAEARAAGVRRGMPLSEAQGLCRDLCVLPPNEALYRRAMLSIIDVIRAYTPVYEPLRFGRAYLDMTGSQRLFGAVKDAAAAVQRQIRNRLRLSAAAGVAVNKLVSRAASEFVALNGEHDGLCDVRRGQEAAFLAPLSIAYLPGVRRPVFEELRDLNIRLIRELAATPVEMLQTVFGRFGVLLHQRAHGIDPRPVIPPKQPPEIIEIDLLEEDSNDFFFLRARLYRLLAAAARRLRGDRQRCGLVAVDLLYADRKIGSASRRCAPADTEIELAPVLADVFERAFDRRVRVRRLTLRLAELSGAPRQMTLFETPRDPKIDALTAAMDKIRDRFGENAVRFGRAA